MQSKKTIFLFPLAVIMLLASSCEKEIKFKQKEVEPKIVINALQHPDSVWVINVSGSTSILDKNKQGHIPNATVSIKDEGGNVLDVLNYHSDGNFKSTQGNKPLVGKTYQLEVSHINYKTVEATATFPNPVPFEIVDTSKVSFKSEESMRVRIRFADPIVESNYYFIKVLVTYKSYLFDEFGNIIDSMYNTYPELISSNDLNVENLDENNSKGIELYVKDNLINGKNTEIDLYLNYFLFQHSEYAAITLLFASSSKEYYLHKISKNKYDATQGNPFAEPVIIYSNIKNGIGIFAGYSYSAKALK